MRGETRLMGCSTGKGVLDESKGEELQLFVLLIADSDAMICNTASSASEW